MGDDATRLGRSVLLDNTVLTNFALVGRTDMMVCLWPTAPCTTASALIDDLSPGSFDLLALTILYPK